MAKTRRLLCVDDHADTCVLIETVLRQYEVVSAHNTLDGLHRARNQHFDLILLDYHMPDGNGVELCKQIRQFDQNTPVLFVTGTYMMNESDVLEAGAQGVVRKTEIADVLPTVVHEIFTMINRTTPSAIPGFVRLRTTEP